jgi:hypothetical protein
MIAPEWILTLGKVIPEKTNVSGLQHGVPKGEHDKFLISLTGWVKKNWALDEEALFKFEREGPLAVLQDIDPIRPYTEADARRHARQGASYAADPQFTVNPWITAYDLPDEQPIVRWVLHGFIPQHKLTFQYGTGGIGKSTWVPWLVGTLLKKGLSVGFSATEETFEHFCNGVRLGMENFDKELFRNLVDIGNEWKFPGESEKLSDALEQKHLDFIYFDSIYDIFDPKLKGSSLAERARPILSPLSIIAQEAKVTILGTFHENKTGDFNGPKDMENIPRALLHATSKNDRLKLHVKKSNYKKPNYDILFYGGWMQETNPNGTPVLEEDEKGNPVPSEIYVVRGFDKLEKRSEEVIEETISINDLEPTASNDEAFHKVAECKLANPLWGWKRISDATGLKENVVKLRLSNLKDSLGP